QPVRSHGTSPATTPGAATRKSAEPAAARSRVDRTRQPSQTDGDLDAPEAGDERERSERPEPRPAPIEDDGAGLQLPSELLAALTGLGAGDHGPPPAPDGVPVRLETERKLLDVAVRAARNAYERACSHVQE